MNNKLSSSSVISVPRTGNDTAKASASSRVKFFKDFTTIGPKPRCLGVLPLESNLDGQLLGSPGRREETLDAPITLQKGVNTVTYKFSKKKSVKVMTMMWKLGKD